MSASDSTALSTVHDRLRRGFTPFELCAHFLQACSKRFNFPLLARGVRFRFLKFPVLFEKLIEQHRVDGVSAQGLRSAFRVVNNQIRIDSRDILGDETILFDVGWV